MDVTILGDDWTKKFYWPDALPAAKPPMKMSHYQHACGQWGIYILIHRNCKSRFEEETKGLFKIF